MSSKKQPKNLEELIEKIVAKFKKKFGDRLSGKDYNDMVDFIRSMSKLVAIETARVGEIEKDITISDFGATQIEDEKHKSFTDGFNQAVQQQQKQLKEFFRRNMPKKKKTKIKKNKCVFCGKKMEFYSYEIGGYVCAKCLGKYVMSKLLGKCIKGINC